MFMYALYKNITVLKMCLSSLVNKLKDTQLQDVSIVIVQNTETSIIEIKSQKVSKAECALFPVNALCI